MYLLVMVGLPGTGKSFCRDLFLKESSPFHGAFVYSPDDLIDQYAASIGKTYSDVFKDYVKIAHKTADENLADAITDGRDIIWDQTNLTEKKRKTILQKFDDSYEKVCACIMPPESDKDLAVLADRLNNRPGKIIPTYVMENMRKSFTAPSLSEGFDSVEFFNIYGEQLDE